MTLALALLLACGPKPADDTPDDTAADTGDTAPVDSEDSGIVGDTGMAAVFFTGAMDASGPTAFGLAFYRQGLLPERVPVCEVVAAVTGGDAPPPCPDCELAFTFAVSGATASGASCGDLPFTDGGLDGYAGAWGFADRFVYTYGDYALPMDDTVWYYLPAYGAWYLMSFRLYGADYYGYAEGDASGATFAVPTGGAYAFAL